MIEIHSSWVKKDNSDSYIYYIEGIYSNYPSGINVSVVREILIDLEDHIDLFGPDSCYEYVGFYSEEKFLKEYIKK